MNVELNRRDFVRCLMIGGVGLMLGCRATHPVAALSPHWLIEVDADGRVRLLTTRVEMGQGAHTGLRTLLAEELDIEPGSIEVVQVPSDSKYGDIITGGSYTIAGQQERIRKAAATARHMLLQAAAAAWQVDIATLTTAVGMVIHATSARRYPYGELVAAAAALPVPDHVELKREAEWRYIGKRGPVAYHDAIVAGAARYGIDVRLPGMCYAVLARAPVIGARLRRFDASAARGIAGFIDAVALEGNDWPSPDHRRAAVAVIATSSWAAQRARGVLQIEWDLGSRATLDSAALFAQLESACERPGSVAFQRDDAAPAGVTRRFAAHYRQPYLAHAPLEPMNATARMQDGRIEVWSGNQRQTRMKNAIAAALQVRPENVVVHATLLGGSFGRRLEVDYGVEAALLTAKIARPVQILWTRDDDLQLALYRSGSVHRLSAQVDASGRLLSFEHRFAAESVLRQQEPDQVTPTGVDWTLATPLVCFPYEVPKVRLEHHAVAPMVPCAWWRGTYWNSVTTAVECFIDEIAQATGQDPLALRLAHLPKQKREFVVTPESRIPFDPQRMRNVLEAVARATSWNTATPGQHRGLAWGLYDSPECHVAVVADMKLEDGAPVLVAATIAVDVGTVVNPEIVEAQAIGGFVMGASVALREQITWSQGQVEQRNFNDYAVLRMRECPPIQVVLVPSAAGMCGIGELVTPAAIAAVSNAASRALGRRVRQWPIMME